MGSRSQSVWPNAGKASVLCIGIPQFANGEGNGIEVAPTPDTDTRPRYLFHNWVENLGTTVPVIPYLFSTVLPQECAETQVVGLFL